MSKWRMLGPFDQICRPVPVQGEYRLAVLDNLGVNGITLTRRVRGQGVGWVSESLHRGLSPISKGIQEPGSKRYGSLR